MSSLQEIQERWRETQKQSGSLDELQRAVRYNGPSSPCISGCRSVCWKTFLLFKDTDDSDWQQQLRQARDTYGAQRDRFLKFIKHPEDLAKLTVDPLADDPNSPWDTVRQDDIIRTEIQQDVQRLPEESNYHEERIQTMILDILFVYCKTYPDRGGYRQGMHELLAPIVHVVEHDAISRDAAGDDPSVDGSMLDMLDASYIEHDAYALFSQLMEHAQAFYQIKDAAPPPQALQQSTRLPEQSSAIVDRSKFIHEVCLQKVDPELAAHLTAVEVLPQIFLIRWIRLIFSREFPLSQFQVLWDTIFAVDPSLDVIDLICVAMLIRIRWQLLEADYSVCLQLLLKYPAPEQPHGPHTFVDDAIYLRSHLNASGGASLILKYTGKMPKSVSKSPDDTHSNTPSFRGFGNFRQRSLGAGAGRGSPSRMVQQPPSIESLFQGAAKGARGVLERGEKLGINQAVREAMGEIRKNMQGFNETRFTPQAAKDLLSHESAAKALVAIERRNRQLASMLDETVANLKTLSASSLEDKAKSLDLIEIAAAKVQFVQIYLEDSTMDIQEPASAESENADKVLGNDEDSSKNGQDAKAAPVSPTAEPKLDMDGLTLKDDQSTTAQSSSKPDEKLNSPTASDPDKMDIATDDKPKSPPVISKPLPQLAPKHERPLPVPTRSTLAQSSFSWMLEPDDSKGSRPSSSSAGGGNASKSPPQHPHGQPPKKRSSNNASREKNAFLFGEVTSESSRAASLMTEEIFGMEPLQKGKNK